jgi:hypothetical protein
MDIRLGDLIFTRLYDADTGAYSVRVDRADGHIVIHADFLSEIEAEPNANCWVESTESGKLMHVKGVNRAVAYRIGELCSFGYGFAACGDVYEADLVVT